MLVHRFIGEPGNPNVRRSEEEMAFWWLDILFNARVAHDPFKLSGYQYVGSSVATFGNGLFEAEKSVFKAQSAFEECLKNLLNRFGGNMTLLSARQRDAGEMRDGFEVNFEMRLRINSGDLPTEVHVGARCAVGSQRSELRNL